MKRVFLIVMILVSVYAGLFSQKGRHTFKLGETEFLLDGKPFQIISGELHPARLAADSWRHSIRMVKALGCNTVSIYVFWNYHENPEGVFDFETGNRNIQEFIKIVQEEEMFLIVRPGPYVCAEWELGGIPPYLLRIPDIKLRSTDERYMAAAGRYITRLSEELKPWLVTNGGPVIMLQIENEYGSYGNDKNYLTRIRDLWQKNGINIPTFTADGPSEEMLKAGTLPGSAVGLDSGSENKDFELAAKINPGVPVFSSETYTGWLTHWGEPWAKKDSLKLMNEIKYLMDNRRSFNLYVLQGGTNFGFRAGANTGVKGYEPTVTSYDYNALVTEQGQPTPRYDAIRELIGSYNPKGKKMVDVPQAPDPIELTPFFLQPFTSLWDNLPQPVISENPSSFESLKQDDGLVLYRTDLADTAGGLLKIPGVHDYALVFLNGNFIEKLDRREGTDTIRIPSTSGKAVLDILVESMGRINYGMDLADYKGITGKVLLNSKELKNWKIYNFPLDDRFVYNLRSGRTLNRPGMFFKGNFMITRDAGFKRSDTYIDFSNFSKGIVWVNGHNIGRYWNIGPQTRLFCPASWLRDGLNEVMILDLHETKAQMISGHTTLK
ncbi:MAG TPA: beta-galactosidase [Bacteroidales bacterium]|nr:beta-galactosidase [Bacteroidales bacterium]